MTDRMQSREYQGNDGHFYVERLREVPVDEPRDDVVASQEGREHARHGENEEEERRIEHASACLGQYGTPSKGRPIQIGCGVFDLP